MAPTYRAVLEEQPEPADVDLLGRRLADYNRQMAGDEGYRPLALFLRDDEGQLVGGIYGSTYWNRCTIDLFWIRDDLRGQGHGDTMLTMAEEEAARRGCEYVSLDTYSFQAPAYYLKRGYTVFGELPDFPTGHSRIYLVKRLQSQS